MAKVARSYEAARAAAGLTYDADLLRYSSHHHLMVFMAACSPAVPGAGSDSAGHSWHWTCESCRPDFLTVLFCAASSAVLAGNAGAWAGPGWARIVRLGRTRRCLPASFGPRGRRDQGGVAYGDRM